MYTRRSIRPLVILKFGWRYILFFLLYSTAIATAHFYDLCPALQVPFLPISAIGIAVAFYLGFKNNSSYDRLWEARRVWGSLLNASRSWGAGVLHFVRDEGAARQLIHRQIAFLNALRVQLRRPQPWEAGYKQAQRTAERSSHALAETLEPAIAPFVSAEEAERFGKARNAATQILRTQAAQLEALERSGSLDWYGRVELYKLVVEGYGQQGAAERIKTFPFPRQYAYFSFAFTWIFLIVLPFGLVPEFLKFGDRAVWLLVPFYTLISFVYNTMEIVGATSENPFENGLNDVPLAAICRTAEIDLREMLEEADLPPRLEPVDDILM